MTFWDPPRLIANCELRLRDICTYTHRVNSTINSMHIPYTIYYTESACIARKTRQKTQQHVMLPSVFFLCVDSERFLCGRPVAENWAGKEETEKKVGLWTSSPRYGVTTKKKPDSSEFSFSHSLSLTPGSGPGPDEPPSLRPRVTQRITSGELVFNSR
jgi:hypothetical protein